LSIGRDQFGPLVAVLLLLLLAQQELGSTLGGRWRSLASGSLVASVPLLAVFAVVVLTRLAELV
jgi:ABC-type glycerol-3-phosphate transport system permease component